MLWIRGGNWTHIRVAAAAVLLGLAGCSHVSRDDLGVELDQLRQEMRQGDDGVEQQLSQRIQSLETEMDRRLVSLENGLRSLEGEFEITVERLESAVRFNAPIHFAFDNATIRTMDEPLLDRFANAVREYYGEALITVEGFADPAGSAAYNLRLGEARAEAVKDYLTGAGIPESRMRTVTYGSTRERLVVPGAQGPGEVGWQNRRVAMVIDFRAESTAPTVSLGGPVTDP